MRYILTVTLLLGSLCVGQPCRSAAGAPALPFAASGFIEADQVAIASELGGRVNELFVSEGDTVRVGQTVATLDETIAQAELAVTQANAQSAVARLAKVKAGARPEAIHQAEAALRVAESTRDAAQQNWADARMLIDRQQMLDLQIVQAGYQVDIARRKLDATLALLEAVKIANDRFEQPMEDFRYWQAWIAVNTAGAAYDGAVVLLARLQSERASPVTQRARAAAASASHQAAEAGVRQAQARLDDARAGATAEQIAVAAAQVHAAQTEVEVIQARIVKLRLTAPVNGLVTSLSRFAGEVAPPAATIMTLTDLDKVRVVIYVPADRLNLVSLGLSVTVQVDGYPGRNFAGTVTRISDRAEFTPGNVQSAEDRATQVYAVTIRLPNPDHTLKPGVPADALFGVP